VICPRCNAEGGIRNGGSRGWCKAGDHSFKITPEMAAAEAEQAKARELASGESVYLREQVAGFWRDSGGGDFKP